MTTPEQRQAIRDVLQEHGVQYPSGIIPKIAEAYERAALSAIYIPTDEPEHNGIVDAMRYITPPQEASNE